MHRDFQRAATEYDPMEFVENVLRGADPGVIAGLKAEIAELIAYPSLFEPGEQTIRICRRWDVFCRSLYHAYQDQALKEVEGS
jgi:hypothetical protein